MDQDDYNERVRNVNDKLSETLKDRENVYFIKTDSSLNVENPHLDQIDGVHRSIDGAKNSGETYERSSQ